MRVTILGSGSRGNATLFEAQGVRVLVDSGLSLRQVRLRAEAARGESLRGLDAIVITHSHTDHVQHLARVARAFGAPVYLSDATRSEVDVSGLRVRPLPRRGRIRVGGLRIQSLPLPHDAANVGLLLDDGDRCVGSVTDLGHVPAALPRALRRCQSLLLELNHDPELLAVAPYPAFVRARIGGPRGHLANAQAAELLRALAGGNLERVVCMHLSERNNSAPKARRMAREALGPGVIVQVAEQDRPLSFGRPSDQLSLAI